jgi:hypothetical protein
VSRRRQLTSAAVLTLPLLAGAWAAPESFGAPALRRQQLQSFTELVALEFAGRDLALLPIAVSVSQVRGDDWAVTAALNDDGEPISAGRSAKCGITYDPDAAALFEQSDADAVALRAIRIIAAHELAHCHQIAVAGEASRYVASPDWVAEGSADWGAFAIFSPDSPAPTRVSEWSRFFENPRVDLFERSEDAVGFWSFVHTQGTEGETWQLLSYAMTLAWEKPGSLDELSYAVLRRAAADREFLARWAMSFVRRPEFGRAWETSAPGLGDERPLTASTFVMIPRESRRVPGHARGFDYADFEFAEAVEVVRVTPRAHGALHWGQGQEGIDDVFTGESIDGTRRWYCLREDGCPCPAGMHRKWWIDAPVRASRAVTLAFFGDHEVPPSQANNPVLEPQIEVDAYAMADAAPDLCDRDVEDGSEPDLTLCDTWASHEDLLALVPGGTNVTGPMDVGTPDGPWACLWTVVGPPLADPLFFEWTVDVWPFVALRDDQTPESWTAWMDQFDQSKGCAPTWLTVDGPPACINRQDDVMEVTVRIGSDRFLWLHLQSLDYPVSKFHSAGEQVALFFARGFGQ